jgi:hypothetical protein
MAEPIQNLRDYQTPACGEKLQALFKKQKPQPSDNPKFKSGGHPSLEGFTRAFR